MAHRDEGVSGDGPDIVCLRGVESLGRITRTQRHLDIGAAATLSRILSIGPNVIPDSLFAAIKTVATPSVRVLASIGGNLCSPRGPHTTLAPLCALGAQLEIRSLAGTRWVSGAVLAERCEPLALHTGDILTRIRLPLSEYDVEAFRREQTRIDGCMTSVHLCGVARVRDGVVREVRTALAIPGRGVIRSREMEARCVGVRAPIPPRVRADLREVFEEATARLLPAAEEEDHQARWDREEARRLGVRLADWFIGGLTEGPPARSNSR